MAGWREYPREVHAGGFPTREGFRLDTLDIGVRDEPCNRVRQKVTQLPRMCVQEREKAALNVRVFITRGRVLITT